MGKGGGGVDLRRPAPAGWGLGLVICDDIICDRACMKSSHQSLSLLKTLVIICSKQNIVHLLNVLYYSLAFFILKKFAITETFVNILTKYWIGDPNLSLSLT